jgi:hypothetical protein
MLIGPLLIISQNLDCFSYSLTKFLNSKYSSSSLTHNFMKPWPEQLIYSSSSYTSFFANILAHISAVSSSSQHGVLEIIETWWLLGSLYR